MMANFTHADFRHAIAKAIGHLADWWDRFYARRGIKPRQVEPSADEPEHECCVCGNPSRREICGSCRRNQNEKKREGRIRLPTRKDTDYE
jgi:hypothetical protein